MVVPDITATLFSQSGFASKLRAGPAFWVKHGRRLPRKILLFFHSEEDGVGTFGGNVGK